MELILKPNIGIGELKFGTPRDEVRSILGTDYRAIRSAPWNELKIDSYDSLYTQLGYDGEDKLQYVELLPGTRAEIEGIVLSKHNLKSLIKKLKHKGYKLDIDEEDETYLVRELGFGFRGEGKKIQTWFVWGGSETYDEMLEREEALMDAYYESKGI